MPEIRISIQPSFGSLANAFMRQNIGSFLIKEVNRLAAATERFSKQLAPTDTGTMKSRIGFVPAKALPRTIVKTDVFYSIYVHEGTKYMRARPFMKEGAKFAQAFIGGQIPPRLDKFITKEFKSVSPEVIHL